MGCEVTLGDSLEVLACLGTASVDAVVTDPPYELNFMGKKWDSTGIACSVGLWTEVLRVLKPGGHLLAFGGTRTSHRMVCAIEDAGFEIRDSLVWMYGTGFPKSLNVGKAIDEAAGATREVVGLATYPGREGWNSKTAAIREHADVDFVRGTDGAHLQKRVTAPATPEAAKWEGFGTALKPAHEPIVMARKPLIGTVAANVLAHGTGALNVDGCRIEVAADDPNQCGPSVPFDKEGGPVLAGGLGGRPGPNLSPSGRWPSNVCLDETAAALLDEQSGELHAPGSNGRKGVRHEIYGEFGAMPQAAGRTDSGGASRFFYTAKASRKERGDGNTHPTVKPVALMRWLVRLVTPPGGTVLDPFTGSGTTGLACKAEGFHFLGIEQDEKYVAIANARLGEALAECIAITRPRRKVPSKPRQAAFPFEATG